MRNAATRLFAAACAAVSACAPGLFAADADAQPAIERIKGCPPLADRFPGLNADCHLLLVPGDWERPSATDRAVQLFVMVFKARPGRTGFEPIISLNGGPGLATVGLDTRFDNASDFEPYLDALDGRRQFGQPFRDY